MSLYSVLMNDMAFTIEPTHIDDSIVISVHLTLADMPRLVSLLRHPSVTETDIAGMDIPANVADDDEEMNVDFRNSPWPTDASGEPTFGLETARTTRYERLMEADQ